MNEIDWIGRNLSIIDTQSRLIPLVLNKQQCLLYTAIGGNRAPRTKTR